MKSGEFLQTQNFVQKFLVKIIEYAILTPYKFNYLIFMGKTIEVLAVGCVVSMASIVGVMTLGVREKTREHICRVLATGGVLWHDSPGMYGLFSTRNNRYMTELEKTIIPFIPRIEPTFESSNGIDEEIARCLVDFTISVPRACAAKAVRETIQYNHIKFSKSLVSDAKQEKGECKIKFSKSLVSDAKQEKGECK